MTPLHRIDFESKKGRWYEEAFHVRADRGVDRIRYQRPVLTAPEYPEDIIALIRERLRLVLTDDFTFLEG